MAGLLRSVAFVFVMLGTNAAHAADVYLGASECSTPMCHGAIVARPGARVAQNESSIWLLKDPHARAYDTLLTQRSQKIARNLGPASAEKSRECLACHTLD